MRNNRTSSRQDWYIRLPVKISITRKGDRAGAREPVTVGFPVGRPTLQWILFFIGTANLTRPAIHNAHVRGLLVVWIYTGCALVAAVAARLVDKLAEGERTPRGLTGLLGIAGFGYSTISLYTGTQAIAPLSAAGSVVLLTLIGEAGYRLSRRQDGTDAGSDTGDVDQQGREPAAENEDPTTDQQEPVNGPTVVEITSAVPPKSRPRRRSRRRRRSNAGATSKAA